MEISTYRILLPIPPFASPAKSTYAHTVLDLYHIYFMKYIDYLVSFPFHFAKSMRDTKEVKISSLCPQAVPQLFEINLNPH